MERGAAGWRGVAEGSATELPLEAVIFDLDGVVTRTAHLHQSAWKTVFDDALARHAQDDHRPFGEEDYRAHVDGRPRHEGVRAFLASRSIELPDGGPDDPPTAQTMSGLGSRKNLLFRGLVAREGVGVDPAALELVHALREADVRVGIATSSRNGTMILQRAGIEGLFDAKVDGVVSAELGLKGKPYPDIFLACARLLGGASPVQTAVVEDAASGVAAACAGGFGLVVGVDREHDGVRLREAGAHWVVRDMSEVSFDRLRRWWLDRGFARPNALHAWAQVLPRLRDRRLAVFLDYDGTLTPIVERPELAVMEESMRDTVAQVARAWPTHVISGRGLADVRRLVGLATLWYAGSHGYDIAAPTGVGRSRQVAPELEPEIHRVAAELRRATEHVSGVLIEDKRFSIAVHHRQIDEAHLSELEGIVDETLARHPALRKSRGKKVFDVRPAMDWDKGAALLWLLESTGLRDALPIYVGDDFTDEDAFRAIRDRGLAIVVTDLPRPTVAEYSLGDPVEVRELLERLASLGRENA